MRSLGVVVIGRNEGERLRRCLQSVRSAAAVVYVDSDSTDDSVEIANSLGVTVECLDTDLPFSAARARNAGLARLLALQPEIAFVQFVDGDCEVQPGWIDVAIDTFADDEKLAVVAGRRRERFPGQSIYNRLCDIEWNTPIGNAKACGGDAMMRVAAVQQEGGFNPNIVAGEEPELCVRLRASGWVVRRIDHEMTLHDAAMSRFGQWWLRMKRSGHAFAEGAAMHGKAPERHWVRPTISICFWGGVVPAIAILLAWPTYGLSLCLLIGHLVLVAKATRHYRSRGFQSEDARLAGIFDVLAKFPQLLGVIKYTVNRLFSRQTSLIEYKGGATR